MNAKPAEIVACRTMSHHVAPKNICGSGFWGMSQGDKSELVKPSQSWSRYNRKAIPGQVAPSGAFIHLHLVFYKQVAPDGASTWYGGSRLIKVNQG
jgi:hypothetical protein